MRTQPHLHLPIRRAFTLIELLVVVAILLVLGSLVFVLAKGAMEKTQAVKAMSRLRQCGTTIFSTAGDHNGMVSMFNGGNGHREQRLISLVASDMGMDIYANKEIYAAARNMVYTPAWDPGQYDNWATWGVNLDDNTELGIKWNKEWKEDENGTKGWIRQINPGVAVRSSDYPLLADSSNGNGKPRLRFGNGNEYKFAMRYGGKGPAIFLDGSSRLVGKSDLARHGIEKAYLFENGPKGKPTLITVKPEDQS